MALPDLRYSWSAHLIAAGCNYEESVGVVRTQKYRDNNEYLAIEQEAIFPHMAYIKISNVYKSDFL